jgi:hypothetical protein
MPSCCESRVRIGRVTIIVHDPATGVKNLFYRGAAIHHMSISDQTRITHIPCNAVPPTICCPWLNQSFDRQNRGRHAQLLQQETGKIRPTFF